VGFDPYCGVSFFCLGASGVLSGKILDGMSGKSGRRDDVTRHITKKQTNACLNLLWRESLREQMQ
jgi:hypothetical protein